MKHIPNIWQRANLFFSVVICWLAVHGSVFAEVPQQKQESPGGNYVMEYGLVLLVIALGLMTVLRPSRRRDRAKPEAYDEIKIKAKA
jgi:uncharacterized membrane protein